MTTNMPFIMPVPASIDTSMSLEYWGSLCEGDILGLSVTSKSHIREVVVGRTT